MHQIDFLGEIFNWWLSHVITSVDAIDHQQFLTRNVCIVGHHVLVHWTLKCSTDVVDKKEKFNLKSLTYSIILFITFPKSSKMKTTLQVWGHLCSSCRSTKWRKSLPFIQLIRAKNSSSYILKSWYDLTFILMNILYVSLIFGVCVMHYAFSYLWWIWRWNRCLIRYLCITSPINILCNWIHGLCTTLNIIRSWYNVGTWLWKKKWHVVMILISLWKELCLIKLSRFLIQHTFYG